MKKFENKVQAASRLAALLHENQMYGEGQPYERHLAAVVLTLVHFDVLDKDLLAAAWLHDAMEDTGVSKAVIEELLGPRVAELVAAVTDEPGANRKERKAKTYPKIRSVEGAVTLKLADRIANVNHSIGAGNLRMFKMYKKEQEGFQNELRGRSADAAERMWFKLEELLETPEWIFIPETKPVPSEI